MNRRGKKPSIGIIITTIILLILIIISSGCVELKQSYIPSTILDEGWYENQALRESSTQSLGLEKWTSITYEINGRYPATLTITTIKTLVLMDEQELLEKTKETITQTLSAFVKINSSSEQNGERTINEKHKTLFIIYEGENINTNPLEKVKIIGELWNCGTSGTSIICIGLAQITNNTVENTENWDKIVQDPSGFIENIIGDHGLIYNIHCHS